MNKLEQAARQLLFVVTGCAGRAIIHPDNEAITALREALAEQATVKDSLTTQEPVVCVCDCGPNAWHDCDESEGCRIMKRIKNAAPQPTQKVSESVTKQEVTLTDYEIDELEKSFTHGWHHIDFARAVIAADREKNKLDK